MLRFAAYSILLFTLIFGVGEALSRYFYNPDDVIQATFETDPILGHKIGSLQNGHDAWGFRNETVPAHTDVLILGDSMTYGVSATAANNWPAHLQRQTKRSVYNAGISGYGPLQYLHVLKERAPLLAPNHVIFTLYLGDDFGEAYDLAYSNENWTHYRTTNPEDIVIQTAYAPPTQGSVILEEIGLWLEDHSVFYNVMRASAIHKAFKAQPAHAQSPNTEDTDSLIPVFKPEIELIPPTSQRLLEGFGITARAISEARDYCRKHNINFYVALIPAKDQVLMKTDTYRLSPIDDEMTLKTVSTLEFQRTHMRRFLSDERIPYADLQPALTHAVQHADIYAPQGKHPNSLGYEVTALAIANILGLRNRY